MTSHGILGGRGAPTTRRLALLERLVERAQETTGSTGWAIYQRRVNPAGLPVLVKALLHRAAEPRRVPAHAGIRRGKFQQHGRAHRAPRW